MKKYKVELTEEQLKQLGINIETEFKYPLFKRMKDSGQICKFTDIKIAEVVWKGESPYNVKFISDDFVNHTDYSLEDVAYDEERDLWDGQPIECCDNHYAHQMIIRFYDAINKSTYTYDGERKGHTFDNYNKLSPDRYDKWIIEAHKTLEK